MAAQRALLIINPGSRRGREIQSEAETALGELGWTVQTAALDEPADLPDVIHAKAEDVDIVVVAGGDGTFNCAADALRLCGRPIGILPAGTANDLARTLGIPADTMEACRIIAAGCRRRIDLGIVNDRLFFNVAHIGFGVAVAEHHTGARKKWFGAAAYLLSVREALKAYRPFLCEIRWKGGSERLRLVQLAVGNGRHFGGGMTVAEAAAIDDGMLDLVAVPPLPWWRAAVLLPRLKLGARRRDPGVVLRRCEEIEIITQPVLPIGTDGEITTETPARFSVLPGALEVFVPSGYDSAASSAGGERHNAA